MRGLGKGEWPVLPVGMQNLLTGENRYFNIFTWSESETTGVLVQSLYTKKYKLIMGAGGSYANPGDKVGLFHDQTHEGLEPFPNKWEVVREFPLDRDNCASLSLAIGRRSIGAAVFK